MRNTDIALVLREIADLLELKDDNPFRIRAYRNLARMLDALAPSVADMLAAGRDLDQLPGVGPDLAGKLAEIVRTGSCTLREALRRELPQGLVRLLDVPGLGPRRALTLYHGLGIETLAQLERAAHDGTLNEARGFGPREAARIAGVLKACRSRNIGQALP